MYSNLAAWGISQRLTSNSYPYIPLPASSVEEMNMSVRYQPTPITDSYIATPLPTAQPIHLSTCAAATSQQLAFPSPVAAVPVFGGQTPSAVSSSLPQAVPILQSCTTEVISGPSFLLISTFPSILSASDHYSYFHFESYEDHQPCRLYFHNFCYFIQDYSHYD